MRQLCGMKQSSRKSPKIADAIVRGRKNTYEFEVFPLDTVFETQSAVYVISRRKTDKFGRGHQKFVCIGQTASLATDVARHKKKCAKRLKANVICVYVEDKEKSRLKIEEDLKAAHSLPCVHDETVSENESTQLESKSEIKLPKAKVEPKAEIPAPEKRQKFAAKKIQPEKIVKIKERKAAKKPETLKNKNTVKTPKKSNNKVLQTKDLKQKIKPEIKNSKQKLKPEAKNKSVSQKTVLPAKSAKSKTVEKSKDKDLKTKKLAPESQSSSGGKSKFVQASKNQAKKNQSPKNQPSKNSKARGKKIVQPVKNVKSKAHAKEIAAKKVVSKKIVAKNLTAKKLVAQKAAAKKVEAKKIKNEKVKNSKSRGAAKPESGGKKPMPQTNAKKQTAKKILKEAGKKQATNKILKAASEKASAGKRKPLFGGERQKVKSKPRAAKKASGKRLAF